MNSIFSLTSDQLTLASELSDIKETDSIKAAHTVKAYDLYTGLEKKPSLSRAHEDIKPKMINGVPENMKQFFNTPKRIIYLTRWVLKVLPFINLLETFGHLPIERSTDDFEGFIEELNKQYLSTLKSIHLQIPSRHNIFHEIDFKNVTEIIESIQEAVKQYQEGYPNSAFECVDNMFNINITSRGYLNKQMTIVDNQGGLLYKMRTGTSHNYLAEEMFHIPFEKRGLVSTNRYSIPGLPCVYLGSSPIACWEELNRPDLNTVQTALFEKGAVSYLDFSTPPGALLELLIGNFNSKGFSDLDMKEVYKDLVSYLVVWPLMAACSIRVKHPNDSFKPEYIIPQLLLQWIRQSEFDGISYFSTKIKKYNSGTAKLYTNYAFPVQSRGKQGYCSILTTKFNISDAIPWQTFQIYKDSPSAMRNEETINAVIEMVNGIPLSYSQTDFSKLESLLIDQHYNVKS